MFENREHLLQRWNQWLSFQVLIGVSRCSPSTQGWLQSHCILSSSPQRRKSEFFSGWFRHWTLDTHSLVQFILDSMARLCLIASLLTLVTIQWFWQNQSLSQNQVQKRRFTLGHHQYWRSFQHRHWRQNSLWLERVGLATLFWSSQKRNLCLCHVGILQWIRVQWCIHISILGPSSKEARKYSCIHPLLHIDMWDSRTLRHQGILFHQEVHLVLYLISQWFQIIQLLQVALIHHGHRLHLVHSLLPDFNFAVQAWWYFQLLALELTKHQHRIRELVCQMIRSIRPTKSRVWSPRVLVLHRSESLLLIYLIRTTQPVIRITRLLILITMILIRTTQLVIRITQLQVEGFLVLLDSEPLVLDQNLTVLIPV